MVAATTTAALSSLTPQQQKACNKFLYNNYVSSLTDFDQTLSRNDILFMERLTRGQNTNELWKMLRMDRQTASKSSTGTGFNSMHPTDAMLFGIEQETLVKKSKQTMLLIQTLIEKTLDTRIVETVLDCGMFFSKFGLNSASPDAYFVTREQRFVPLEIKCPHSYRDVTADEMRNAMNTRQERYRVPHTALSVNRTGPPLFRVSDKDPHYRQMQRQIYVLDAPFCVYFVKFKNSCVVRIVERDEKFVQKEAAVEQKVFDMYVQKHKNRILYKYQHRRDESFAGQNHLYTPEMVRQLTHAGLYYSYGNLLCAFCNSTYDSDLPHEIVLKRHTASCTQTLEFARMDYFDHSKRLQSLNSIIGENVPFELATDGVFYENNQLKTFCCNQTLAETNLTDWKHKPVCRYPSLLTSE